MQNILNNYLGTNPCPKDFDVFWQERMAEAQNVELDYEITPSSIPENEQVAYDILTFRGIEGELIYAKYIRPKTTKDVPLILQFHGYPGASRNWFELSSFAGMNYAMIAMDCPGQGGYSEDKGGFDGTTVSGHIIAGLDGPPEKMYYVKLHQDIAILCRITQQLEGIDSSKVYANGASQGGALALACTALNPHIIKKAAVLYPFLSDFQKVWELDADLIAYEGLRYYMRWYDPQGKRIDEIFTQLGYFDTQNFAHMVKSEILFGTGLIDTICPPITQYAVYNKLTCPKKHFLFPKFTHEEIQEFDDMLLDYFDEEVIYNANT